MLFEQGMKKDEETEKTIFQELFFREKKNHEKDDNVLLNPLSPSRVLAYLARKRV